MYILSNCHPKKNNNTHTQKSSSLVGLKPSNSGAPIQVFERKKKKKPSRGEKKVKKQREKEKEVLERIKYLYLNFLIKFFLPGIERFQS